MDRQDQGARARKAGDDFERVIEGTFDAYRDAELAVLDFYPVPMRPTGIRDPKTHQPLYAPQKGSPCDVMGFCMYDGRIVVAELKSTSKHEPSLPIILPTRKSSGHGVMWHQLCMLRNVAVSGGISRLVWSNGGEVGVLREKAIVNLWARSNTALRQERRAGTGRTVRTVKAPPGLKSVKWLEFEEVTHEQLGSGLPVLAWLKHERFSESITYKRLLQEHSNE